MSILEERSHLKTSGNKCFACKVEHHSGTHGSRCSRCCILLLVGNKGGVCMRERERERVCVCMCLCVRVRVCVHACVCVCVVCVWLCMCACVWLVTRRCLHRQDSDGYSDSKYASARQCFKDPLYVWIQVWRLLRISSRQSHSRQCACSWILRNACKYERYIFVFVGACVFCMFVSMLCASMWARTQGADRNNGMLRGYE